MQKIIRRWAIEIAHRRPAPNRIPLSSPGVFSRNYFTIHLGEAPHFREYVVNSLGTRGMVCFHFNTETNERTEATVPYSSLRHLVPHITYYFRDLQVDYHGAADFLINLAWQRHWFALASERAAQFFFNRRELVRKDRMDALRHFVSATQRNREFTSSVVGYMTALYGPRWIRHPDDENLLNFHSLILESLVQSEDLQSDGVYYRLRAQALATLDEYEREERHHRDQFRQQYVLLALTFGLIVVGIPAAMQAAVALFS